MAIWARIKQGKPESTEPSAALPAAALDTYGRSDLHYAAMRGDIEPVRRLIDAGADISAQDRQGFTPLHFASQEFRVDVAELLLAAGAEPTVRDTYGNTALWTATFNSLGRGQLIALLLAHGADPDSVNDSGASPRSLAALIANFDVARFFTE